MDDGSSSILTDEKEFRPGTTNSTKFLSTLGWNGHPFRRGTEQTVLSKSPSALSLIVARLFEVLFARVCVGLRNFKETPLRLSWTRGVRDLHRTSGGAGSGTVNLSQPHHSSYCPGNPRRSVVVALFDLFFCALEAPQVSGKIVDEEQVAENSTVPRDDLTVLVVCFITIQWP